MPALPLSTDAFVLLKRPPADSFQTLTVFSPTHGTLLALQRLSKKSSATTSASPPLDLFDEAALRLESSNQGQTWFIKESQLLARPTDIGRSYDALRHASALASLVARNPVAEESRLAVAALLRQAFAALATTPRPDFVWFKSLYLFARDEGYPIKEHWFPTLVAADREAVAALLNRPLAALVAASAAATDSPGAFAPAVVESLSSRLADYLRAHTEIILD